MMALRYLWAGLRWLLATFIVSLVQAYRLLMRPLLPQVCRFEPSCSEYMILSVRKYGPICGACKGAWRICRCHPWNDGGIDPP